MDLLDNYFEEKYPTHLRRANLLNFRCHANQKDSSYFQKYEQKAIDAGLLRGSTPSENVPESTLAGWAVNGCKTENLKFDL